MIYKNWKEKFVSGLSPYLIILSVSLMFFSASAIYTVYNAQPQQAIAQTTTAATPKPTSGNFFLTYENNSTLGIKIQYPANWERIESEDNVHGVLFLSPSESNSDRQMVIKYMSFHILQIQQSSGLTCQQYKR